MAIEDLDLEFEDDEDEGSGDAIDVDVDLSFSANGDSKTATNKVAPKPIAQNPNQENNVRDIKQAKPRATPTPRPATPNSPSISAQTNVKLASGSEDILALKNEIEILKSQMQKIQSQADVRVAVAEAEKSYLVEYVSNAKVLDHQVSQILARINKKVPALSAEVQSIKKHLQLFVKKSVPEKKGES